jgi:GNAT superfamily N-acetyltransferase
METYPHLEHWLGSLYVKESYRGAGIGTQMVGHAVRVARELGVVDLYLYTHSHESFYQQLGWKPTERPTYHNRTVVVMVKDVTLRSEEIPKSREPA